MLGYFVPQSNLDSTIANEWFAHASDLAAWTWTKLVNRTDAWGGYYYSRKKKSVVPTYRPHERLRGARPLSRHDLFLHFTAGRVDAQQPIERDLSRRRIIGLPTTSPENTCRFICSDIDQHDNDETRIKSNLEFALAQCSEARSLGFHPLLTTSNGTGGFHNRIIFSSQIPAPDAYAFAGWLNRNFRDFGIEKVEPFPKQPLLTPAKPYGNWVRLPGIHHKRDYWATVWDERTGSWAAGAAAARLLLSIDGDSPSLIPAEALTFDRRAVAGKSYFLPADASGYGFVPAPITLDESSGDFAERARRYLAKLKPAISGQHGHDATFHAACVLRLDFNLSFSDALPIFQEWNCTHCQPQWSDDELEKKLNDAGNVAAPRGRLLVDRPFSKRSPHPDCLDLGDPRSLWLYSDPIGLDHIFYRKEQLQPGRPDSAPDHVILAYNSRKTCRMIVTGNASNDDFLDSLGAVAKIAVAAGVIPTAGEAALAAQERSDHERREQEHREQEDYKIASTRHDPQRRCKRAKSTTFTRVDGTGGRILICVCGRKDCEDCFAWTKTRDKANCRYHLFGSKARTEIPDGILYRFCVFDKEAWQNTVSRRIREAGGQHIRSEETGLVWTTVPPTGIYAKGDVRKVTPLQVYDEVAAIVDAASETSLHRRILTFSHGWGFPKEPKSGEAIFKRIGIGPAGPSEQLVQKVIDIATAHKITELGFKGATSIYSTYLLKIDFKWAPRMRFTPRLQRGFFEDLANEETIRAGDGPIEIIFEPGSDRPGSDRCPRSELGQEMAPL